MNKELFMSKFNNNDTVSTKVLVNNAQDYLAEVIVAEKGSLYKGTITRVEGFRTDISGDIKEVLPVKVTTTEFQEVLTLKGTKQELVNKLFEALMPEMENYYLDVSQPYTGALQEYERASYNDIAELAEEVVNDMFSIGG